MDLGLGGPGWGHNPDLQSYLTAGSFEIFRSLQLDMGYDIEFHAPGGLQAVHTAQQWDHVRDRVLQQKAEGYNVELLTTREARAIEPEASESLAGFVFFKERGRANPPKLPWLSAKPRPPAGPPSKPVMKFGD
ncbi:MAG: FAD-dependent oxidoreductase [Chloroflexi bacterium]|nr:FAD-dependent oxidoreductase [Chloroflexota bacterium]